MKELVSKIQEVYATFSTDAALQIEKGNKMCIRDRGISHDEKKLHVNIPEEIKELY